MSIPSPNDEQRGKRPTLPPIRDLFREELSHPAVYIHDSPPLTLERLCMRDDVEYSNSPASQDSYSRELPVPRQPTYRETAHRDISVPYYNTYWTPRYSEQTQMPLPLFPDASGSYDGAHEAQEYTYLPPSLRHQSHSQDRARPELSSHDEHITAPPRPSEYHFPPVSRPPRSITTSLAPYSSIEDEAQTPIARFRDGPASYLSVLPNSSNMAFPAEDTSSATNISKYECKYCGKGFNRPSSLKIHTNSHTGEKPFICPIEACGRSFSVLSNMRRHARVHQIPIKEKDASGDEGWNITAPDSPDLLQDSAGIAIHSPMENTSSASRWHHRRDSSASTSSGTSRRSQGTLSDDEDDDADNRPEKRIRQLPK